MSDTPSFWNRIKVQGEWLTYEYKDSWGKRYYSFDGWKTQARTKRAAYTQRTKGH